MGSLSNLYISQSYQSLIHLGTNNTASANLIELQDGLGNSIGVAVNTNGDLFLSGSLTASLQQGYLYVGDSTGKTTAFATSSLVTNINTGSLVTTSSFNSYTQSTNIRLNNLETTSASVNISISNLNSTTASQAISISNLNTSASLALTTASLSGQTLTFTKGDNSTFGIILPDVSGSDITALNAFTASQLNINTGYNTFTSSANQRLGSLETTSASVNISVSALNTFTASQSTASIVTSINNLNTFSASALVSINELNQNSASVNTSISNINQFTQSAQISINSINAVSSSWITESETASFARTNVDNNFSANQTFTNITATSASITYLTTLYETASVIYSSGSNQLGDELTDVQTLSGSVKVQGSLTINGTPVLTSSVDIGGLVTTASFNAYTQSNDQKVSSLETNSASVNTSITNINSTTQSLNTSVSNLNQFTASQSTASIVNSITELNTFSASALVSISNLNASSASQQISIDNLNTNSASVNTSITNINSATASLFTSTSLSLVTASFNNGTRDLTFTKGDNTTFAVNIPDVSGSTINTGSFATTSSFNAYTQSNDQRVSSLETNSASVNTSISNINQFTQSANISINALNAATSSYVTSAITSSSLITASVSLNTITFTKGDGTTFPITVNTGSGGGGGSTDTGSLMVTGSIAGNILTFTKGDASTFNLTIPSATGSVFDTGSFATTGSNTFNGDQTVNGKLTISSSNNSYLQFTSPNNQTGSGQIFFGSLGPYIQTYSDSLPDNMGLQLVAGVSGSFALATRYGGGNAKIDLDAMADQTNPAAARGRLQVKTNGQIDISGFGGGITISGSQTTIQGFTYPNTDGTSGQVLTTNGSKTLSFTTVSGGGTNYINPTLNPYSGSLILVANTYTSSSFAHISASANGQVNLVFKNNNNTADTIISGSNNIFTNAAAPTAGFKRYIGGSNNIINTTAAPLISGSMGISPTMSNNLINGANGLITMRGPVSSSAWTISNNIVNLPISVGSTATNNAEKAVAGVQITSNLINNSMNIIANRTLLKQAISINNNQTAFGTTTLNAASSSIIYSSNVGGGITITNNASGGLVANSADAIYLNANLFAGTGNSITATGSQDTGDTGGLSYLRQIEQNQILGASNGVNLPYAETGSNSLNQTMIAGYSLGVTGSNASSFSGLTQNGGSAFFGRWNAQDGNRAQSAQTVFAVGTGNSTTRKTGFLIDSGSNTSIEGTLRVSGSTTLSGSLYIQSGSTLPSATGSSILTWNPTTGQVSQSPIATLISSSFSVGAFNSTITQSGSAAVSQSMTFNNTDISNGVSIVSNSQITLANTGTYNIQFSAQINAPTGADTIWIWLKKNGTNVSNTATKLVLANNEANVAAWNFVVPAIASDYFELVWENNGGHAQLLTEAAAGNYPAIPSIILTVTQVE